MGKDKNVRKNLKRQRRNSSVKLAIKHDVRSIRKSCEAGNPEAASETFAGVNRKLDKAAGKGIISKNTAARKKSRMARRINALKPAS